MTHAPTFSRRILVPLLTFALLVLGTLTTGCDSTDPDPGPDTSEGEVPYADLAGFFAQRAANQQSFSVSPNGGTITTDGGMELTIRPEAFRDADGDTVRSDVEIQVREAFSLEDMINTNLVAEGTGGRQLITGGMFDIDATTAGGDPVTLNTPISVNMPANTNTDPFTNQMTVWTADRDADTDTTTWTNTEQGVEATRDEGGNPRWFFQISDLRWMNCDVWWDVTPKFNLTINQTGYTGDADNLNLYVVSSDPTGVISAFPNGQGAYVASALAGNNTYTVVAIAVEDNVQYYGELDVQLNASQTVTVNLVPTSEADLDAALQAL